MYKTDEEIVKKDFPDFIQMIERTMNFNRWGFRQTFAGSIPQFPPSIIYDSKKCRVRFMWQAPDRHDDRTNIIILYGRSHAPLNQMTLEWNNELCHCWHNIDHALYFLDRLSPQERAERRFRLPEIMERFEQSEIKLGINSHQPEWLTKMHSSVWEQYGERLFEFFDVRNSDLWDKYINFLKEYDRLTSFPLLPIYPPPYKVC